MNIPIDESKVYPSAVSFELIYNMTKQFVDPIFKCNKTVIYKSKIMNELEFISELINNFYTSNSKGLYKDYANTRSFDLIEQQQIDMIKEILPKTIETLEITFETTIEIYNEIKYILPIKDSKYLVNQDNFTLLTSLQIVQKAIEYFREILILIKNNIYLATNARWRTLFELQIILVTLLKEDSYDMTFAFVNHDTVKLHELVQNILNKKKGFKNIKDKSKVKNYKEIIKSYNFLIEKFGDKYNRHYGWFLHNQNIDFLSLMKNAGYSHLEYYYEKSHISNHGNSSDLFEPALANQSLLIDELEIPIQNTIISINNIINVVIDYASYKSNTNPSKHFPKVHFLNYLLEQVTNNFFNERKKFNNNSIIHKFDNHSSIIQTIENMINSFEID